MIFDKNEYTEIDNFDDGRLFCIVDGVFAILAYFTPMIVTFILFM